MDVMEFFQQSSGKWRSQRTTHHLAFRRSEEGEFEIEVEALGADHPKVLAICELHEVDSSLVAGGAYVSWQGSMAWDKEGDHNQKHSTIFALLPDAEKPRQGILLRERGYAEDAPVAGHYHMDDGDGLVLTTQYAIMNTIERFWFANPNFRLRTSTVQRLGGFTTATFCTELRIMDDPESEGDASEASTSD